MVIGVENGSGKMKVSFSQSIRYIEFSGSPFNADGGSNLDADFQGIAIRASRVLFLWFDRLLLTCFLLAAAAPYLDPRYYWYGAAMAVALPLLAGMMLPCALLLWRLRRPTLALVHLLLVIALVPRHFSLERFDRPQAKPSDLVLMSLNAPRKPESDVLAEKLARGADRRFGMFQIGGGRYLTDELAPVRTRASASAPLRELNCKSVAYLPFLMSFLL